MRKINEVGLKLIEYKEELTKDYPKIVKDSLLLSLEQMVTNDVIDMGTYEIIKNTSEGKDDFISYLYTNKKYVKSYEELFKEYEVIREELDEELKMHELFDLNTETVVEEDCIYVSKTFSIDEKFVSEYFGVDEEELVKLMKRKGFVEKFAALRLVKILKDVIKQGGKKLRTIKLDNSLAYFGEDNIEYNIDLIMKIPIDSLLELEKKNEVLVEIKETKALAEKIYKNKMIC